jgi:Glycosyl hydrolase family 10
MAPQHSAATLTRRRALQAAAAGILASVLPPKARRSTTQAQTPSPNSAQSDPWTVQTLREVGDRLGIYIGTTVDGSEDFHNPIYIETVGDNFSLEYPSGAFLQSTIDIWGLKTAQVFRDRADLYNQIFLAQAGIWHGDHGIVDKLRNAPNDDVTAYMVNRANTLVSFARKVGDGYKPTIINVITEPFTDPGARFRWQQSPYYRVYGDDLITQAFLMYNHAAINAGFEPGKDIRFTFCDYNLFAPGLKQDFAFEILTKSKKDIAASLGKTVDQVSVDVALECHFDTHSTPVVGFEKVPSQADMLNTIKRFSQIGRIHLDTLDVRADDLATITQVNEQVIQTAIYSEAVDSVTFYNTFHNFVGDNDGPDFINPNGLFDNYQRTAQYDDLVRTLLQEESQRSSVPS